MARVGRYRNILRQKTTKKNSYKKRIPMNSGP